MGGRRKDHVYAHINNVVALATAALHEGGGLVAVWVEVDRRMSAGRTTLEAGQQRRS